MYEIGRRTGACMLECVSKDGKEAGRMKLKRILIFAAAAAAACMITACSSRDAQSSGQGAAGTGTAGGSQTGAGTSADAAGQAAAGDSQEQGNDGAAGTQQAGGVQSQGNASQADPQQEVPSADETYDAADQSGEDTEAFVQGGVSTEWDGIYSSATGESVTLAKADEHTVAFAFTQSGIGGNADADGNEAVYSGDDDMKIVFELGDTTVTVQVLNADGNEEESGMNGEYSRQ